MRKFGTLSLPAQTVWVTLSAIVGADLLTLIFYGIFFTDRLLLDLFLTTVITILVGFPLAYFFLGQQAKLAVMAAELKRLARTDHLTDLANRGAFLEETAIILGSDKGAMLFIDADHFKSINDTFGHATGDAVLRQIAGVIRSSIRAGDLAARIGGEEFAVFLTGANDHIAAEIAERIRSRVQHCVAQAVAIADRQITVSIGVVIQEGDASIDEMMSGADSNLYRAKNLGRNRITGLGELVAGVGFAPAGVTTSQMPTTP
jgi:diguanylate cyclase (GGDEF)-like protein